MTHEQLAKIIKEAYDEGQLQGIIIACDQLVHAINSYKGGIVIALEALKKNKEELN